MSDGWTAISGNRAKTGRRKVGTRVPSRVYNLSDLLYQSSGFDDLPVTASAFGQSRLTPAPNERGTMSFVMAGASALPTRKESIRCSRKS
jgi:hypothetical protein